MEQKHTYIEKSKNGSLMSFIPKVALSKPTVIFQLPNNVISNYCLYLKSKFILG